MGTVVRGPGPNHIRMEQGNQQPRILCVPDPSFHIDHPFDLSCHQQVLPASHRINSCSGRKEKNEPTVQNIKRKEDSVNMVEEAGI
jgi:hypothetical protein